MNQNEVLHVLVIDIGATSVASAMVNSSGTLASPVKKRPTRPPLRPEVFYKTVDSIIKNLPEPSGVVIGFPGQVESGVVLASDNLSAVNGPGSACDPEIEQAWVGLRLADILSDRLGCRVLLANDADIAALGCSSGEGKELTLTLGTGIGTGLTIEGVLAPHVEHPQLKSFIDVAVDVVAGEHARKTLSHREWEDRIFLILRDLREIVPWDHCYLTGGNARRLSRDRLNAFDESVRVVTDPAGLLGASALFDQLG